MEGGGFGGGEVGRERGDEVAEAADVFSTFEGGIAG